MQSFLRACQKLAAKYNIAFRPVVHDLIIAKRLLASDEEVPLLNFLQEHLNAEGELLRDRPDLLMPSFSKRLPIIKARFAQEIASEVADD